MKEERNFAPYPIYPPYQGMGPMPFGMPNMPITCSSSDNNNIEQRISNLEQRVNKLENVIGGTNNNYNSSNYQML